MQTWLSWVVVISVIGLWYWQSQGRPRFWERFFPATTAAALDDETSLLKGKGRRRGRRGVAEKELAEPNVNGLSSASAPGTDDKVGPPTRKRKINAAAPKASPRLDIDVGSSSEKESSLSTKDFASQMTQARSGATLAPSTHSTARNAGRVDVPSPSLSAAASSTTGADADDDRSPSVSPTLEPNVTTSHVADMLEEPAAPASVLRITGEAPKKKVVKPTEKATQEVETKKQRQARKKKEEQKARSEEAERIRRQLEDQQRRGARMAEGTSKQQKADAFAKATQQNAWAKPLSKEHAPRNHSHEPLDTYDDVPANGLGIEGTSSSVATRGSARSFSSQDDGVTAQQNAGEWVDNRLSEEEQIRQFQQQDQANSWNTVGSKRKHRGKADGSDADSIEANGIDLPRSQNPPRSVTNKPSKPGLTATNSYGVLKNGIE